MIAPDRAERRWQKDARAEKSENLFCPGGLVRVFRLFRGQSLLSGKLEKNGTSPKTWYRAILRPAKLEPAAHQNDPNEIERKPSRKFLQFLENFSWVYTPRGAGKMLNSEC
jgi:hypothetical protein